MARLARVVVVDAPHHVTQRGNARQSVLSSDADRAVYLDLLGQYLKLYELALWGYCLMSNHVHLITVPHRGDALALVMKQAQGRFSSYWNAKREERRGQPDPREFSVKGIEWRACRDGGGASSRGWPAT